MDNGASRHVVLIVDDDERAVALVDRAARSIPRVSTVLATSAVEALRLVEQQAPDLVITELEMPGKTGRWLLGQIHSENPLIPIAIHTGSLGAGEASKLLKLGAARIIRKPAAAGKLREALVALLERPVRFELEAAPGSSVFLAGSFNNWSPGQLPMRDDPQSGLFVTSIPLPPGHYEYKFIVNDAWLADPKCADCVENPFGSLNSVADV